MHQDPPALELILSDMTLLVRRAFAEGHRIGLQEAHDRMTRALTGGPNQPPAQEGASPIPSLDVSRSPLMGRMAQMSQERRLGYGSVITNIRRAIVSAPDIGLNKDQIIDYCFQNGQEVTIDQFKDTMKRLVNGGEVRRLHQAYFIGPRMRLDLIPIDSQGLERAMSYQNTETEDQDNGSESQKDSTQELFG